MFGRLFTFFTRKIICVSFPFWLCVFLSFFGIRHAGMSFQIFLYSCSFIHFLSNHQTIFVFGGFVLSLLSSAVVTFSPIASLREEVERANDDESPASE